MDVCRQITIWAHPATGELEDEINSNSSSIHKQRAAEDSLSFLPCFTTKRTGGDLDAQYGHNIGNSTAKESDGCDADDEDEFMQQEEVNMECSMCGHAGLPQYLFKCLCCSCRFQHTYCSKLYPYRMEASMCNWCLPLKSEIAAEEDDDDNDGVYHCNTVNSDIATESDSKSHPSQQVQQIKKHSKAFEYLLQITADLADEIGCNQLLEAGGDRQTEHSRCCNNDVSHDQIIKMCRLQQNNTMKEDLIEGKSITARTGEAESFNSALSHSATTPSKRPRCNVNGSSKPGDCDQLLRKRTDHNKLYDYKVAYDQDLWMQTKSLIDDDKKVDVTASINAQKRLRVICKKQSIGIARGVDSISNLKAANGRESFSLLQGAAAPKMCFDDVAADDDDDERRSPSLRNRQMSPPVAAAVLTSTWVAATQSKPAAVAGKRDHLTNSPSRAFNRRYKLLADVLC